MYDNYYSVKFQTIQTAQLVRDDMEKRLWHILVTNPINLADLNRNSINIRLSRNLESIQEWLILTCKVRLQSDVVLHVMKSKFMHDVTNITLCHFNWNTSFTDNNIVFSVCIWRVYIDNMFDLVK